MAERAAIRQHHLLARRIDEGNEIAVNNQALADAYEAVVALGEHPGYVALYLPQLHGQHVAAAVGCGQGRVVAVGTHIYDCAGRHAEHLRGGGENEASLHSATKIRLFCDSRAKNGAPGAVRCSGRAVSAVSGGRSERVLDLGVDVLGGEAEFLVEHLVGSGRAETGKAEHVAVESTNSAEG